MAEQKRVFQTLGKRLRDIVGNEWVNEEAGYLVVRPKTNEEVSRIVKLANRTGRPVVPMGAGTGWWSSKKPQPGGILIRLARMKEILRLDKDSMTVTAQAGITCHALEERIGRRGFRLAISPESGRAATIGGHLETWGTSPHTSAFFEDQSTQVIGLKVVLPTGEIVQTGTSAVTGAAGNFARRFFPSDLTGLFIGAEGAFGIITEVTLKVHGQPEAVATRAIEYGKFRSAMTTLRKIQEAQRRGGLLTLHEQRLLQKDTFRLAVPRLAGLLSQDSKWVLCLRAEGDGKDVESHMDRGCGVAATEGGRVLDDPVPEWWEGRYGLFPELVLSKGPRIMLVVMVPMGRYERACAMARRFGNGHGMDLTLMGYPLAGPVMLMHVVIRIEEKTAQARNKTLGLARRLLEALMDTGCVPHRVGTDFLPVLIKRLDPSYYRLVKQIKKLLDPMGIMRPGLVVPASSMASKKQA